ncbi:MAG: serine/threonine protein kinase [Myxococcales bacterium]|nr:serine/threonine protein kinase [Myxococcales bacterium]
MSGIPAGAGSLLGKRLGKYEILALLALGGTAEIYLARIGGAAGFEKYVVVKSIHDHLADDQEFVKMFLDEARLAAHLDHSNIVQTMELGEQDNRYYMVMEFLAGLSLAMVVRRAGERLPGGRIPAPLVLNMMAQACGGLHYAHERAINGKALNIVHRDISPQNLVVSFEGVVKVVDFGIAKAEQRQTATRAGTIKGKFAYMSPEQCVATNVDRRTDVFALGVIAHELLTGRRLFKRNSPYETYQAVIECAVDPPSKVNHELDPAIDEIIMRAVAKDKDERYPTAEAFGDALMRYLHHRGKGSGPGDIGRFFDESFGQEIEEHGARMRELISGRDFSVDTGVKWGTAEEEAAEAKRNQTVDLTRRQAEEQSMSLHTSDLHGEELGDDPAADDSDMPAERTRIETNPLDRLAEMEAAQQQAKPPAQAKPQPQVQQPRAPTLPAAPPVAEQRVLPKMPPSGPLPLPAPPTGPAAAPPGPAVRPSAARFPNLSNLPTQIAMDDVPMETVLEPAPDPVRSRVGSKTAPEMARTAVATDFVDPNHGAPMAPNGSNPNLPMDYPVMNPEFSQQMLSGNVFPSAPPGSRATHAADRETQQRNAESGPRPSQTSPPPSGPQHAASLMSPVGQQYPQQVDWAQAAAAPARALPPWMMIALFVAAIGVALVLTIVVAKIIR